MADGPGIAPLDWNWPLTSAVAFAAGLLWRPEPPAVRLACPAALSEIRTEQPASYYFVALFVAVVAIAGLVYAQLHLGAAPRRHLPRAQSSRAAAPAGGQRPQPPALFDR